MIGNAQVFPFQYFYLNSIPIFDGIYQVTEVKHSITPNDMKTSAEGIRMRFSKGELAGIRPVTLDSLANINVVEEITDASSLADRPFVTRPQPVFATEDTYNTGGIVDPSADSGVGIGPIVNLVIGKESGGDYGVYNFGKSGGKGIRSATVGSTYYYKGAIDVVNKTINEILVYQSKSEIFAVGKYQTIPITLKSKATSLDLLNSKFDAATQEKIGASLFLGSGRPKLAAYLKGTNTGSVSDLEKAVQDLGQEFASMPIIKKGGKVWGDVKTGQGNKAYYGGSGPNPDTVKITVGTVVVNLIKSRIQYSGKEPEFIPSYYK
jgi:hypothetical protein